MRTIDARATELGLGGREKTASRQAAVVRVREESCDPSCNTRSEAMLEQLKRGATSRASRAEHCVVLPRIGSHHITHQLVCWEERL